MEGMSSLLYTAKVKGRIRGFQIGDQNSLEITHLQHADDTLVFCYAVEKHALILRAIFIIFEAVSGLHINRNKSFIYPINKVVEQESLSTKLEG